MLYHLFLIRFGKFWWFQQDGSHTFKRCIFSPQILPGALVCSEVLGRKSAENSELKSFFSSVPLSFLTHIQLVLVEGWPAISSPMLTDSKFWAAYLVIFICLSNFALLNLVTGVVCERVMELAKQLPPATAEEKHFEFDLLKQQMAEIYDATPKKTSEHLNQHEYSKLFKSVLASELLDQLKVTLPTHSDLLRCLIDEDDNGKVTCAELQEGLMRLRGNRFDDVSRAMQCTVRKCMHRCFRSLDEAEVDLMATLRQVRMPIAGKPPVLAMSYIIYIYIFVFLTIPLEPYVNHYKSI